MIVNLSISLKVYINEKELNIIYLDIGRLYIIIFLINYCLNFILSKYSGESINNTLYPFTLYRIEL